MISPKRISMMLDLNRRGIKVEDKMTAKDLRKLWKDSGGRKLLKGRIRKHPGLSHP